MATQRLKNALATTDGQAPATTPAAPTLRAELTRHTEELASALPAGFPGGAERFTRLALTAVAIDKTGQLGQCTNRSIIGALIQAAQLGLNPNMLGEAWLIPRKNGNTGHLECSFQVGYKGLVVLAQRAGVRAWATTVYEGDEFDWSYDYGNEGFTHKPALALGVPEGETRLWYAQAVEVATNRPLGFWVQGREWVEKRRKAGAAANSPAWRNWYDEMARGKVLGGFISSQLPTSVEIASTALGVALASDGAVRNEIVGKPDEYRPDELAAPEGVDPTTGEVIEVEVVDDERQAAERAEADDEAAAHMAAEAAKAKAKK